MAYTKSEAVPDIAPSGCCQASQLRKRKAQRSEPCAACSPECILLSRTGSSIQSDNLIGGRNQ